MNKNNQSIIITKASGDKEPFSLEKYKRSLRRAHVPAEKIEKIIDLITPSLQSGMNTKALYQMTYDMLKKLSPVGASRYSLKEALRLMGPSGFPFEKLVARLLEHEGYTIALDQTLQGKCITHETDIVAHEKNKKDGLIVECKFHNQYGFFVDVHTPLYVKARFDDIHANNPTINQCMLATNTKFSQDSIAYGDCVGMKLLSWGYPRDNGLESKIERYQLFPITTLISLQSHERDALLHANFILCKDLTQSKEQPPIKQERLHQLLAECSALFAD